jgi:hypothetical protein
VTGIIRAVPMYGAVIVDPFVNLIHHQKDSLHNRAAEGLSSVSTNNLITVTAIILVGF